MIDDIPTPRKELLFIPLGGAGEIGMNFYLYGCSGKWLAVDLGITFGDDSMPFIDVMMPDPTFIEAKKSDLAGLVITHGHEDHLGAVAHLWPRLGCPVYATPFAAELLRGKLEEAGLLGRVPLREVPQGAKFDVGPFAIELITMTHSIPEPNAVVIRTPLGTVLHTGDWKFDSDPLLGPLSDTEALRRIGDEGVLAMVGDSTNAMVTGASGSEGEVRSSLIELFSTFTGRIAVACFASNVARLESIAVAAAANGRRVALVGRSMKRIAEAARRCGYLTEAPPLLSEDEVRRSPRDEVLYICTGSQGEPRSALARIAGEGYPGVELERGDVVIFSSRVIPGNERAIHRLQNQLTRLGVRVVNDRDHFIHVSGHPAREELTSMYGLVRPRIAIPIHGEMRHLAAHAALAESCGVKQALVTEDGGVVRLAPGKAELIGMVQTGRLAMDGPRIISLDSELLRSRKRTMFNGVVLLTLVVDRLGHLVADPQLSAPGIFDPANENDGVGVVKAVRAAVSRLSASDRRDDELMRETVRLAVRRSLKESHGKKPTTDVHLVRV